VKLLRGRAEASLDDRLVALAEAADLAEGRLDQAVVDRARDVVARAGVRRSLSVEHTAVALAGATGSGKSSIFNALAGRELAEVGATRPTTSKAQAALWGPDGSGPLLDWLGVPVRHVVGEGSGLILLDLPDHDSIVLSHRLEVDRLVGVVDLLVWVLDPQKYADAAVHERYLKALGRHRDNMLVVLNQIDRLPERAIRRCLDDLRGLLTADGLEGVPVLGVSARTGQGVSDLRTALDRKVSRRTAWAARLAADVGTAADALSETAGATSFAPVSQTALVRPLSRALSEAAAVPLVVRSVAKAHRHRAVAATGWPVTRWVRGLRPDPLRRLHLSRKGRTSLPAPTAVQLTMVDTAVRDVGAAVSEGVPEPWASAVRHAARSRSDELGEALDRAVATASLGASKRPRWWRVIGTLQWLVTGAMAAGALWLLVLAALGYLLLPRPPTPTVGQASWPTVLLLGGAVAGVVIALLSRAAAWIGGRRRARKVAKTLRASIDRVGEELVIVPACEEQSRYVRFVDRVASAG
jgi:GTP-binding protein EngB required for normal cell division